MRVRFQGGLFLVLLLIATAAGQSEDFTYTTNNGTISITAYTGPGGSVTIPDTITGLPVTEIASQAFSMWDVTNVVIPGSITNIASQAFSGCVSLMAINVDVNNSFYSSSSGVLFDKTQSTLIHYPNVQRGSYYIPDGVTSIGDYAFENSWLDGAFFIPITVTNIGVGALAGCIPLTIIVDPANPAYTSADGVLFDKNQTTLIKYPPLKTAKSYIIPQTVTNIEDFAFHNCGAYLAGITLKNGVTTIGRSAFSHSGVTNVTLPDTIRTMGTNAFEACWGLTKVIIGKGLTTIPENAFIGCSLVSVAIPDSIKIIGDRAFQINTSLTSVTIGSGVGSIGALAFDYCNLTDVFIPSGVTNIGPGPFARNRGLTRIRVDPLNPNYVGLAGVLFSRNPAILIQYPSGAPGAYTVPDQVEAVGDWAFTSCGNLSAVSLPYGVMRIGDWAFYGTGLASVTVPDSVVKISDASFSACSGLTNLIIGSSVTSIGVFAFAGTALTGITIPRSVTYLGDSSFASCSALSAVYFKGDAPALGTNVFLDVFGGGFDPATVYYLPHTSGWGATLGGLPAVLWNPQILTGDTSFGVRSNRVGFNITGSTNTPIVIEGSTDLASGAWTPLQNCTLTNGLLYFSDPQWTNYPKRFYRIRSP